MQCAAWIIGFLIAIPTVSAGDWDRLSTDLDLFEQVIDSDQNEMSTQQKDAELEGRSDLFPVPEGEEEEESDISGSEDFVTISVDGSPVILTDVPSDQWFAQFVKDAAELQLISGYRDDEGNPTGEFGPADFVTLEQLAKMAVVAAGIDPYSCGDTLKNAGAKGRWSQRYVQCAEYLRWAVFSDGSVDVSLPADRAEVVVTVLQAFSVRISPVSGTVFEDVTRATPFGNAIETAAQSGVVSGYLGSNGNPTGYFGPEDPVNRAETAKIFSLSSQAFRQR